MNNIKLSQTSYGRKILFSKILSAELCDCKYKIDAFFEWAPHNQVFSVSLRNDGVMRLAINLNAKEDALFGYGANAVEFSVLYRAYFIANYIRAIEGVCSACPSSYYAGILTLGVINNICSGIGIKGYTPTYLTPKVSLNLIDFQCGIQAMTRLMIEHSTEFSREDQTKIQRYVNMLIDYRSLPEVAYSNSSYPVYTCISELKKLQKTLSFVPTAVENFALLKPCGGIIGKEINATSLLHLYQKTDDVLWLGLYMRILALSGGKHMLTDRLLNDKLQDCITQFRKDSLAYYSENNNAQQKILKDNLLAIIFLSDKVNQICSNNECLGSGIIHYY